jgi:pimeloyl-ACP methyl ester carboxylesterase
MAELENQLVVRLIERSTRRLRLTDAGSRDEAAYIAAYAREGRMDAAFDYCRRIVDDMEFNKMQFAGKLPIRLLAVGGQYSIPTMGESLQPYFQNATSLVIPDAGHFVPEEQPEALAKALVAFLSEKE